MTDNQAININKKELPENWDVAKLEDVVDILDRKRIPINAKERAERVGTVPYYGATGQVGWIDDYLFDEELVLLGEDAAPFFDISKHKAYIIRGKSWVNNHAHVLRALNGIPNNYIKFYLDVFDYHGYVTGTTRLKLNQTSMRKIPVPIAPPDEQKRIVAEIEKQFSRLDEAVENLKRVKANLKRYKASVLKAAVEGKLTEEWRKANPDIEPADKLLERILAERRKKWEQTELAKMKAKGKLPKDDKWKKKYKEPETAETENLPDIPPTWLWARLDSVTEIKGGITKDSKRKIKKAKELPYLRVANVQRGYLDLDKIKYIKVSEDNLPELLLKRGDILFNEGGDRDKLGRGWIWEGQIRECTYQNHVFRARLFLKEMPGKLFSWYGNTFGQQYFMAKGKQTTNLASINKTMLSALPIPLPPFDEQVILIKKIEGRLTMIDVVEKEVDASLKRADRLRQSILKKAFSGKLIQNKKL